MTEGRIPGCLPENGGVAHDVPTARTRCLRAAFAALACAAACTTPAPNGESDRGQPLRVIVAEFTNPSGDPLFDRTLRHASSIALAQVPGIEVLPGPQAIDALRAMNRSPDDRLTADAAWEIAAHEGLDVVVLGAIETDGPEFLLSLDAVSARTGETLARSSVAPPGPEHLIDALGEASWILSERLRRVPVPAAARVPLSAVTTGSLEGLAQYARGRDLADKGRHRAAVPYFEQALTADPQFGLARDALSEARRHPE